MAFLQVYFNGELKFTAPLQLASTTIGRAADNDIVINNSGVSGHHAVILKEGDVFYISDRNSTNGIYLNGRRILREALHYGDEISIFKHKLKFVAVDIGQEAAAAASFTETNIPQDQTVFVNAEQVKAILHQQRASPPYIVPVGGEQAGHKLILNKANFDIGKTKGCDLHAGGWFAPKLAAVISRQSDGFYLVPEVGGKVFVNGKRSLERVKLHDGDEIEVQGQHFSYHQPEIKS